MSESHGSVAERELHARIAKLTAALEAREERLHEAIAAIEARDRKLRQLTAVQRETEAWVQHLQRELVGSHKLRRSWSSWWR